MDTGFRGAVSGARAAGASREEAEEGDVVGCGYWCMDNQWMRLMTGRGERTGE